LIEIQKAVKQTDQVAIEAMTLSLLFFPEWLSSEDIPTTTSATTGSRSSNSKDNNLPKPKEKNFQDAEAAAVDFIFQQAYSGPPPPLISINTAKRSGYHKPKSSRSSSSSSSNSDQWKGAKGEESSRNTLVQDTPPSSPQSRKRSFKASTASTPFMLTESQDQEINCTTSSASVSTITGAAHTFTRNKTMPQRFDSPRENQPPGQPREGSPTDTKDHQTQDKSKANSSGSGNRKLKNLKRTSSHGIQKALSKLNLCGHSARESSLDLEYLVLSLRQSLTGQEAESCLRKMVTIMKDARSGNGDDHNGSKMYPPKCTTELQEELVAAGADHCVISTLWNFPSDLQVQYQGIMALGELVAHSNLNNQKSLVLKGGIEVVLTAMKAHAMEELIQEEACRTLKNIMKYYDVAKHQVARHKGVSRILQAMMIHTEYTGVQRQACYALTSLSCLKPISDDLVAKQGHSVLLKTMHHHNDDPFVLAEAWRTLTNIVIHAMNTSLDEEIANHGTLELVCQSLHKFADCTLVPLQARGLTLLTHLCYRSDANLERVTRTQNLQIIRHILRIHTYDEKVQAAGEKLIQQMSIAGYSPPNNSSSQVGVDDSNGVNRYRNGSNNSHQRIARSRSKNPSIISHIHNDHGMDIILDTTYGA